MGDVKAKRLKQGRYDQIQRQLVIFFSQGVGAEYKKAREFTQYKIYEGYKADLERKKNATPRTLAQWEAAYASGQIMSPSDTGEPSLSEVYSYSVFSREEYDTVMAMTLDPSWKDYGEWDGSGLIPNEIKEQVKHSCLTRSIFSEEEHQAWKTLYNKVPGSAPVYTGEGKTKEQILADTFNNSWQILRDAAKEVFDGYCEELRTKVEQALELESDTIFWIKGDTDGQLYNQGLPYGGGGMKIDGSNYSPSVAATPTLTTPVITLVAPPSQPAGWPPIVSGTTVQNGATVNVECKCNWKSDASKNINPLTEIVAASTNTAFFTEFPSENSNKSYNKNYSNTVTLNIGLKGKEAKLKVSGTNIVVSAGDVTMTASKSVTFAARRYWGTGFDPSSPDLKAFYTFNASRTELSNARKIAKAPTTTGMEKFYLIYEKALGALTSITKPGVPNSLATFKQYTLSLTDALGTRDFYVYESNPGAFNGNTDTWTFE